MKKLYVVGGDETYSPWIEAIGYKITRRIADADLVMFTGGEDVDPALYGEQVGNYTYYNRKRDDKEADEFNIAKSLGIPCIGICRGSQFLCVMNGGKLIQDVSGHESWHSIRTHEFYTKANAPTYVISSTHHQMQFPYNLPKEDYILLAWSEKPLSSNYLNGDNKYMALPIGFKEAEIVWYPKTKCLAIQGHPEYLDHRTSPVVKYLQGLIKDYIENGSGEGDKEFSGITTGQTEGLGQDNKENDELSYQEV